MWAFLLGAVLIVFLGVTVILVRRKRRSHSLAAEYQLNVNGIRLATYQRIAPRYARQVVEPFGYQGPLAPARPLERSG